MPTFETPAPIAVTVELGVGYLHVTATDRTDTVVEVRPTQEGDESDVKAAKQVRTEYNDGTLLITGPKIRAFDMSKKSRSVDVNLELPAGSRLSVKTQLGDLQATGELGECSYKTGAGHVQFDATGQLHVDTGAGHVKVNRIAGTADISTGTGRVQIGEAEGALVAKNSNGEIHIGDAAGDLEAKTSNGTITVGAVHRGSVSLKTAHGDIEAGISKGVAAWLDVHTGYGRLRNELEEPAAEPGPTEDTVEVRADSGFGDITIRRA
ncbi:DUF4097 domain-containing protein [Amycolatopsis acidicola]|uniref:DUF4097 domain-containing protein n=1 Tax=Amycolatopsis acidicola TaxID=2596893 RepID=A0A5N0VLT2_9PSEU|nr:DUF4097 family beta strand repeat-containing protein [Amycolatopsis acidicola]KAA9165571.1 DUF4097 domain-containing protein [Amycolatopsis acidicola]